MGMYEGPAAPYHRLPLLWFGRVAVERSYRSQEKKSANCCRFESLSDSGIIAQFLAFYRPNKTLTDN